MANIESIDFSVDVLRALLWQRNDAINLQSLITQKQVWYDESQSGFWNDWLINVFDLQTASDFGCVVWAIILGIPVSIIIGGLAPDGPFGFSSLPIQPPPPWSGIQSSSPTDPSTNVNQNFGGPQIPFAGPPAGANFAASNTTSLTLTTAEKRIILRLRYRQMCCRGTVFDTNKILNDILVPVYGPMWIVDNHNMTETLALTVTVPDAFLSFLFSNFDLIPRPSGVSISYSYGN